MCGEVTITAHPRGKFGNGKNLEEEEFVDDMC
jgi:hypothetical protein